MRMKSVLLAVALLLLGTGMASAATIQYTVIFEAKNLFSTSVPALPNPALVSGAFTVDVDNTQNYTNETSGIDLINLNLMVDSQLAFNYNAATDEFTIGGLAHGASTLASVPAENDFWLVIRDFSAGLLSSDMYQFSYAQTVLGDIQFITSPASNPNNGFALVIPGAVVATTPIPAGLPLLLTALGGLGFAALRRKRIAAPTAA